MDINNDIFKHGLASAPPLVVVARSGCDLASIMLDSPRSHNESVSAAYPSHRALAIWAATGAFPYPEVGCFLT